MHQLYVRILPVVVVAVLSVGLFSGRLLSNRAVRTYLEQRATEQKATLTEVLGRISARALSVASRADGPLTRGQREHATNARGLSASAASDLFDLDGVCGVGWFESSGRESFRSFQVSLRPDLDAPRNRDILRQWTGDHSASLSGLDNPTAAQRTANSGGARRAVIDIYHTLWIYPPLNIVLAPDTTQGIWAPDPAERELPVLPVVVCDRLPVSRPGGKGPSAAYPPPTFLLLDIASMVDGVALGGRDTREITVVVDAHDRIVHANVDSLKVGSHLSESVARVFPGVSAADLAEFLYHTGQKNGHAYLGSRWSPYVFMLAERAELPLMLLSALPFSEVNGGMALYTAIVVLMATIALLGSILAIMTVGGKLSKRLEALAVHMGKVASGNYFNCMETGKPDEVGRLVGFFNMMTEGLDEAHRELREKTQHLRIALAKMKRLDKAKDDFLSLISHEVRTPLTSIMGGIEYFHLVLPRATEEQKRACQELNLMEITEIIESSGNRLRDFMNDAILMASLQSSDTKLQLSPISLGDMCELVLSGLQEEIAAKRLSVHNELSNLASWQALGDRELMVVALEKLLRNAVQHNVPEGTIRIAEVPEVPGLGGPHELLDARLVEEQRVKLAAAGWEEAGGEWRIIQIYNTGPAIPPEKREALFNKFELVGRIEHHQKGSGLSLCIVQAVLEHHAGRIHVDSRPDDGNYFYLILPVVPCRSARPDQAPSGQEQGQGLGGASGDEEVHLAGNRAALDVEFEHVRS